MRVSVGDVELYVHEQGKGRPLVALHGGPGLDGSVWFPALDDSQRVATACSLSITARTGVPTRGIRRGGRCRKWQTTSKR